MAERASRDALAAAPIQHAGGTVIAIGAAAEALERRMGRPRYEQLTLRIAASIEHAQQELRLDTHAIVVVAVRSIEDVDAVHRIRHGAPGVPIVVLPLGPQADSLSEALLAIARTDVIAPESGQRESAARIAKALRKVAGEEADDEVAMGALAVDLAQGRTTWHGTEVPLSRRERELLAVLLQADGKAVRRSDIYRRVWGYAMARGDRTVDVNIRRIRAKLAAAGAQIEVTTQPGVGYRLTDVTSA